LVESALTLIRREGIERATMRAIARQAGVSHAAPYHHFSDLDDLLASVAAVGFRQLRASMAERAGSIDTAPLNKLQEAGVAYVGFATSNPDLYRLMFSHRRQDAVPNSDLSEAASAAYAELGRMMAHASQSTASRSRIDPASTPGEAVQAAWALVHGLSMLLIDGRLDVELDDRQAVDDVARRVTAVLGLGLRSLG
jgi:AcrR family transcriptional regulator